MNLLSCPSQDSYILQLTITISYITACIDSNQIRLNLIYKFKFAFELMYTILTEPIQKQYLSSTFSRSWLISAACCLFAFILPILILISIGYSWKTYNNVSIVPSLTFRDYQTTCLESTGKTIYDSSFINEPTMSYAGTVSVGVDGDKVSVYATYTSTSITSCSILAYFTVTLKGKQSALAVLPLSFHKSSASLVLSSVKQWGTIEVAHLSAIPQSYLQSSNNGQLYYLNGTQSLSMIDVHQQFTIAKNLTINAHINGNQNTYLASTSVLTYTGSFLLLASSYVSQTSLIDNLRTFVPHFIYIFILLWVFVKKPIIAWILKNRIYKSKVLHTKFKLH